MKNKKGLWIPIEILEDEKLDNTDKLLLSEIYSFVENNKNCFASNAHFGKLLGLTKGAASKRITKLSKLNYIHTKNQYEDRKCVGRYIFKGAKNSNQVIDVPEKLEDSSDGTNISSTRELGGTSFEDIGVVPQELGGSSEGKPTNTRTNTVIQEQLEEELPIENTIENSNAEIGNAETGMSIFKYYEEQYTDAVYKLGDISGLGLEVFEFVNGDKLELLKNRVGLDTFQQLEPVLQKYYQYEKLLNY